MPPDASPFTSTPVSSTPRPPPSTRSSYTRTDDGDTPCDPRQCLTRVLFLLHGLEKHIRQEIERQGDRNRPKVVTFGDPLRSIRQRQRRLARLHASPTSASAFAKEDTEARRVERQMDDVVHLLLRGVQHEANVLETSPTTDWTLLAALIFVLTACCAGDTATTTSAASSSTGSSPPPCTVPASLSSTASSPESTFSASTSIKSRMLAAYSRAERARHLVDRVRELVREQSGSAGDRSSARDVPTVRGKRLVTKACDYAVSDPLGAFSQSLTSGPPSLPAFLPHAPQIAHLGDSVGHACECRSFWREVHTSKHLEPDEITSFFLLSEPMTSPPIPQEERGSYGSPASRGPLSPRQFLGDISIPFPGRTTPPDDCEQVAFTPPNPGFSRTISRQASSIFSNNSFSSLFSNPGEGLRRSTRSSTALPQLSQGVYAQAEPSRSSVSKKRSPLAQVWASTSREQDTVADSLSRVRHKYSAPRASDKDVDAEGLWVSLRKYWRPQRSQSHAQQPPTQLDDDLTPRMAPRPEPPTASPGLEASIRSPLGRLASVRSPSLHARAQSSPELPALIASGAMLRKPRDWQAQPALAPLATELRQAEERSKMTQTMTCSVCNKHGVNYPKCMRCGLAFCSRECRIGVDGAGDGKKHACGLLESRRQPKPTQRSGIHLGLEAMHDLYSKLAPITTPYIHIAGTNGKGSVSAMVDAVCVAGGLRTGRFNSPHLITVSDSICINGKSVDQATFQRHLDEVKGKAAGKNSEFEITTAVAFSIFAASNLDILLIECGMGGLRDATNVLPKDKQVCAVLTAVDLDHQGFLGNTVEEIATDKLGIVRRGGLLVVGEQEHKRVRGVVEGVQRSEAAEVAFADATRLRVVEGDGRKSRVQATLDEEAVMLDLPLQGPHQLSNLATALQILTVVRSHPRALDVQPRLTTLKDSSIASGIARTRWRGRCDWVDLQVDGQDVSVLTDGAHNASAARHLRDYIASLDVGGKITFVLGLSHSPPKTPQDVLRPLLADLPSQVRVLPVIFTTPVEGMPWIKPVPVEDVARAAQECGVEVLAAATDLDQALQSLLPERGDGDLIVVTGSLYLVADVYRLEEKDRTIKGRAGE